VVPLKKSENDRENETEYENAFLEFSGKVERFLRKAALVAAVALVIAQTVLQFSAVRYRLVQVERMEGVPFTWHVSGQKP
jgi:hypothetical protein